MEFLVTCALIGLIPAAIASAKGRSFGAWWFYGAMLFIIALPHAIFMSSLVPEVGTKKCIKCAELIKQEALICKHCGSLQQ
jgi:hypothetical protein